MLAHSQSLRETEQAEAKIRLLVVFLADKCVNLNNLDRNARKYLKKSNFADVSEIEPHVIRTKETVDPSS